MQELQNASQGGDRYSFEMTDTRTTTGNKSNDGTFNNPLRSDSLNWGITNNSIEGWGSRDTPQSVPTDIRAATMNLVSWFIGLNIVIVIFALVVRLIL